MRRVRVWIGIVSGIVGVAVVAPPAMAGMAAIETTAALSDQSEASVKAAVDQAVNTAIQGAKAMGLPRVELRGARVLPGAVTVLIIARDTDGDPVEDMLDGTSYDDDDEVVESGAPTERSTL